MKKTFLFLLTAMTILPVCAQERLVEDGFYRVQNYGTKRYAYIYDNTGSVNISTTSADMGAIVLHSNATKRLSDPASVIYASNKGKSSSSIYLYDLEAQGTGVYKIINYYVTVVKGSEAGTYWVYEPTYNMYLWDETRSTFYEESSIGTDPLKSGGKVLNEYRSWNIYPVKANTDEYLGISPNTEMKVGNKYYKPYYISFAFDFASAGMKAYYVSDVKSDAVIISKVVGTVPAMTPVIVECSSSEATNNRVELLYNSIGQVNDNQLAGQFFCYADHGSSGYKAYDASTMRVLGVKDGKLCYVTDTAKKYSTELAFSNGSKVDYLYCLNANESYLPVPAGTAESLPVMTREEYEATHSKKGDVNGDGRIDIADIAIVYKQISAGVQVADAPSSDVNSDKRIDIADIAVIYKMISAGQ